MPPSSLPLLLVQGGVWFRRPSRAALPCACFFLPCCLSSCLLLSGHGHVVCLVLVISGLCRVMPCHVARPIFILDAYFCVVWLACSTASDEVRFLALPPGNALVACQAYPFDMMRGSRCWVWLEAFLPSRPGGKQLWQRGAAATTIAAMHAEGSLCV